jgi:hypothetical protein
MKAYGIDRADDNCCPGHAKYGRKGLTPKGVKRPRNVNKDRPRKKKARQLLITF